MFNTENYHPSFFPYFTSLLKIDQIFDIKPNSGGIWTHALTYYDDCFDMPKTHTNNKHASV